MPSMIITGAAHGLGKSMAQHAAQAGYKVGVLDLVLEQAEKVAQDIGGLALAADVNDPSSIEKAFAKFDEAPDVLINNAGILRTGALMDHSLADFRRVIDINLTSIFIVAQVAARRVR